MKLTVLICTHNRLTLLQRTLRYLDEAQRPDGVPCEVLVMANGCDDGSVEWLAERAAQQADGALPLRYAEERRLGKSHALNHAIRLLKGSDPDRHLVAFVDDDHRVDSGYLLGAVKAAQTFPEFPIFCGRILPDWDGREPQWVHEQGRYRIYPLPVPRFERGDQPLAMTPDVGIPGGGNLVLRAGVFERVGGFSTDLGPQGHDLGGGEDGEFVLRAQRLGERIQYVPWFTQYHYVELERLKFGYLLRKSYQRTKASTSLAGVSGNGVPLYQWRKLAGYLGSALFSLSWSRTRFFLVRTAAAWGEVAAFRQGSAAGPGSSGQ